MAARKDMGYQHLKRFMHWQDDDSVQELLSGKKKKQYDFWSYNRIRL